MQWLSRAMLKLLIENTLVKVVRMKEGYRFLGEYIRQVDIRNKEGKKENLLGVSVQKQFIQSIANTVGTDFTKYKVVKRVNSHIYQIHLVEEIKSLLHCSKIMKKGL